MLCLNFMKNDNVALFDFCETLVSFQTADVFIDYVRLHENLDRMNKWEKIKKIHDRLKLVKCLEYFLFKNYSFSKRIKLYQLKNFSYEKLSIYGRMYYNEVVKPNFIKKLINEMERLKEDGFKIYIVSGGYNIYLKYFVEDYNLEGCFCSIIDFKNNMCTGKLSGPDCMGKNKVLLLNKSFIERPQYSISYSDSITDLPMLLWANKGVVVAQTKTKWSEKNNLDEIIWES